MKIEIQKLEEDISKKHSLSIINEDLISGITLIALVITITVLLILAGVTLSFITGENGILNKSEIATEKTNQETAKEAINFKITSIQIETYAKTQKMPTLQELANEFCNDEDFQYVELKSKKTGSLKPIDVSESSSIFTKLKEYPYEFEIDSNLRLAGIDGIKLAENNTTSSQEIELLKTELTLAKQEIEKLKTNQTTLEGNYNTLQATVESNYNTLNENYTNLSDKIDDLPSTGSTMTVTLLGTTTGKEVLNCDFTKYKKIYITTHFTSTDPYDLAMNTEVSVSELNSTGRWYLSGAKDHDAWWYITSNSMYTNYVARFGVQYEDSSTTYVYGIK